MREYRSRVITGRGSAPGVGQSPLNGTPFILHEETVFVYWTGHPCGSDAH